MELRGMFGGVIQPRVNRNTKKYFVQPPTPRVARSLASALFD